MQDFYLFLHRDITTLTYVQDLSNSSITTLYIDLCKLIKSTHKVIHILLYVHGAILDFRFCVY